MPSYIETIIQNTDSILRTLFPPTIRSHKRPSPAEDLKAPFLNEQERKHVAGLMRVNHAGEVAAQALYQAQAWTAKSEAIRIQMHEASLEETDHLAWCEQRLTELGSKPSILNPVWYFGSFLIGTCAGLAGDALSLGFVAETEKQVSAHLNQHLQKLPMHDAKTRTILEHMQQDEEEHAKTAMEAGAMVLPPTIKTLMRWVSKIMTKSSYYL